MHPAFLPGLFLFATACAGSNEAPENGSTPVVAASVSPDARTTATASSSGAIVLRTTVVARGGMIGVPECDEYVSLVRTCYADQPALQAAFLADIDAWKQQASEGGAQRDALRAACQKVLAALPRDVCNPAP